MGNFTTIEDHFNYGNASNAHTLIYANPTRSAGVFRALIGLMYRSVAVGGPMLYGVGLDADGLEDSERHMLFESLSPINRPAPTLTEVSRMMDERADRIATEFYTDDRDAQRRVATHGVQPVYLFINDLSRLLTDGDSRTRSVVARVLTVGRSYGVYLVAVTPSVEDEAIRRVRDNIMSELIIESKRRKLSPYFRDLLSDAGTIVSGKN